MTDTPIVGIISDIQKFSLHDGAGIRTTVFLKGCNMRCVWCHNPETYESVPDLLFFASRCIGCGACYRACPTGALAMKGGRTYDRDLCTRCGACAGVCAPEALQMAGTAMTVEQVMRSIRLDAPYYAASGGGVTLSGGEPLLQAEFSAALLMACRRDGIHTAMETNLSLPFEKLEPLLPWLDGIFCDIKLLDDAMHRKFTGLSNHQTLDNIRALRQAGIPVTVRTPLIPGMTDSPENIAGIARWLKANAAVEAYELLNYNPLAKAKFEEMGLGYPPGDLRRKTRAQMDGMAELAAAAGIPVRIGGE